MCSFHFLHLYFLIFFFWNDYRSFSVVQREMEEKGKKKNRGEPNFRMNAKDALSLNFQLWCSHWMSSTQLLVGGGSGRAKTGFQNGIALVQLNKDHKFEELKRSVTDQEIAYSIRKYKVRHLSICFSIIFCDRIPFGELRARAPH